MSHKRSPVSIEHDNGDYAFSEEDPTFYKQVDEIDSLASSPTNPPTIHPVTPSRSRSDGSGSISAHQRASALRKAFELRSPMPLPMEKKLFTEPTSSARKNGKPLQLVIIDSDEESDEERGDVSKKEYPLFEMLSPATSMSSQGSMTEWSVISANSSISSSGIKRDSDARPTSTGSPSQYRKVGTTEYSSSHVAQAPPVVVEDVFSAQPPTAKKQEEIQYDPESSLESSENLLDKFLNGPIGVDLETDFIAHDTRIQALLDKEHISWGVQFELARGVTTSQWTWEQVESKIGGLTGPSAKAAYRVRSVMLNIPQKSSDLTLWEELDREQLAIIENRGRGLGLMGEWQGERDWHGGQIQQLGRLVNYQKTFKIQLEPMEKRRSHRFARYLGSRRMIQLRIPDELVLKELPDVRAYLSSKFVLCGRIFVPLHAKDNSVYLVETNEDYERRPGSWCGDEHRHPFANIISWHNPLNLNKKQPISKWSTRFALGLSNSIPVLIFDERNIFNIDDIYASDVSKEEKPPAEKIMTDGCGFINHAAALIIRRKLNLPYRPTAVQARIKGAKGMFIIHPTDTDEEAKIWIRKSQDKMTYLYPLDRAHRILDLLTISQYSGPITLSRQSILNLSHNEIPDELLIDLLIKGLTDEVKPLMDWGSPQAMISLWHAINRIGGVTGSRTQRQVAMRSRAIGLQGREWGHVDVALGDNDGVPPALADELVTPTYSGRNDFSGVPLSKNECAMELLQAGFRPDELNFLRDKIRYIVNQTITTTVEKFQIPVPLSTKAFIIPDPLGVLREGEIFYRSSREILHPEMHTLFNVIVGNVLLGRYPLRLPSDIQKVQAVDIPELYDWPDVVITSTEGTCSLASLLSGGDHDGDDVFLIFLPRIVEHFQSKQLTEMPKTLVKDYFEGNVESVTAFSERVGVMSTKAAQEEFQEICLLGLNDSKVGLYSNYHDYAVWKNGLDDPMSIRMAYMFNVLLDSSKTGLRLKAGVFEKDRARFGGSIPDFDRMIEPFILRALYRAGKTEGDALLEQYDKIGQDADRPDKDLKAPYSTFSEFALDAYTKGNFSGFSDQLKLVRDHVMKAREAFNEGCRKSREGSPKKKQKRPKDQKDPMLVASQMFAEAVDGVFSIPNIDEVKASYAYHESPTFAFAVAFRELCLIKARASPGGIAPSIRAFDESKTVLTSYLRAVVGADPADPHD